MNDELSFISVKSNKLKVIIIGGGKAGFIKAKSFLNKGAFVKVISQEFCSEFKSLLEYERLSLSSEIYSESLINQCHIVVIATSDKNLNDTIRNHCEKTYKIYIDTTEVDKSLCITPTMGESKNIVFALHTKGKSPKTSVFVRDIMSENLMKYDDYVEFSLKVRNSIDDMKKKIEVMNFISTKDFLYFFNKGYGEKILKLFYGGLSLEDSN